MMLPDASRIGVNDAPPQMTVKGRPLCAIITPASCQPPSTSFAAPPAGPGTLQLADTESLCLASKSDGPSSCVCGPKASGRSGGVNVLDMSIALPSVYAAPNCTSARLTRNAPVIPL